MADYPWKNLLPEWVSLTLSSFPNSFSKKLQRPWVLNMTIGLASIYLLMKQPKSSSQQLKTLLQVYGQCSETLE